MNAVISRPSVHKTSEFAKVMNNTNYAKTYLAESQKEAEQAVKNLLEQRAIKFQNEYVKPQTNENWFVRVLRGLRLI